MAEAKGRALTGWCEGRIGRSWTLLQYVYATPVTGPAYYLKAIWRLDAGSDLRLTGMMRDTARAELLLEIARSVRVTGVAGESNVIRNKK